MDNFGGIAILVLIWIVGAVFDKKKKEERRRRQMAQQGQPTPMGVESVSDEPRPPDASQREGSKLEQVLRQLNVELADQTLEESRQQTAAIPEAKVRSVTVRSPVEPVAGREDTDDFMAKAERAIARRRLVAEEYSRGRTAQDHATFHEEIRRPVAAEVESLSAEAPSLEQAIIWREILGPPRAMTIDEM